MIAETPVVPIPEFEQQTGWAIRPEGACINDRCIALPQPMRDTVDLRIIADSLKMPLIHDEEVELWCLGPEAGGKALSSANAPEVELPDWRGDRFRLTDLRGRKVLLLAWAPW